MSGGSSSLVRRFVDALDRGWKYVVLVLWFGTAVGGLLVMKKFIQNTSGVITPPPGTSAYEADNQIKTYFHNNSQTAALLVLFETTGPDNYVTLPPNTAAADFCNSTERNSTAPCVISKACDTLYTLFSTKPLSSHYQDFFVPNTKAAFSVNYYSLSALGAQLNNFKVGAVAVSELITNNTLSSEANQIVSKDKRHTMMVHLMLGCFCIIDAAANDDYDQRDDNNVIDDNDGSVCVRYDNYAVIVDSPSFPPRSSPSIARRPPWGMTSRRSS